MFYVYVVCAMICEQWAPCVLLLQGIEHVIHIYITLKASRINMLVVYVRGFELCITSVANDVRKRVHILRRTAMMITNICYICLGISPVRMCDFCKHIR